MCSIKFHQGEGSLSKRIFAHFHTPSPMDGRGALLGPEKCVMASAATTYLLHMMEDINIEVSEAFIELHHHAKRVVGSILPERLER